MRMIRSLLMPVLVGQAVAGEEQQQDVLDHQAGRDREDEQDQQLRPAPGERLEQQGVHAEGDGTAGRGGGQRLQVDVAAVLVDDICGVRADREDLPVGEVGNAGHAHLQ